MNFRLPISNFEKISIEIKLLVVLVFEKAFLDLGHCNDYIAKIISQIIACQCSQPCKNKNIFLWCGNFNNYDVNQILREIKFGESRTSKTAGFFKF